MCKIQAGYFIINDLNLYEKTYNARSTDEIHVECWAKFEKEEIGKKYKAELKIILPEGKEFSFYTPLMQIKEDHQFFNSVNLQIPIPAGKYSTSWFVIYDENGQTICDGHARGLNCENVIITT
jgi:hypothetical protein